MSLVRSFGPEYSLQKIHACLRFQGLAQCRPIPSRLAGAVQPGASEPVWIGKSMGQIDDNALYALDSYVNLFEAQRMRQFVEKIFGQPVFISPGVNIRYAVPRADAYVTPAHQDHFFVRQTDDFRTLWVPHMDIDERVSPLALAARFYKHGLVEHVEQEDVYSYILKGRKQLGVPLPEVCQT